MLISNNNAILYFYMKPGNGHFGPKHAVYFQQNILTQ